jgi:hypothetical protein
VADSLDLDQIRARLDRVCGDGQRDLSYSEWEDEQLRLVNDVPALVAEVERLNEVVAAMDREHAELIAFLVSVPSSMRCACGRTVTLDVGSD